MVSSRKGWKEEEGRTAGTVTNVCSREDFREWCMLGGGLMILSSQPHPNSHVTSGTRGAQVPIRSKLEGLGSKSGRATMSNVLYIIVK